MNPRNLTKNTVRRRLAVPALLVAAVGCDKGKVDQPQPAPSAAASPAPRELADLFGEGGAADNRFMAQDKPQGGGESAEPGENGGGAGVTPKVALTAPGAEPRALLAYDFAIGKPQTVIVTFAASTSRGGKAILGQEMPPLRLTLSAAALTKPSPAVTQFEIRLVKAETAPDAKNVPPELTAEMQELSKASGVTLAQLDVSAGGTIGDVQFSPDPKIEAAAGTLLPLLEQALTLFFVPVPVEPVGVGAKWTTTFPSQPGTPEEPPSTWTLKAVGKGTATIETMQVQPPERRDPDPEDPQSPPGPVMVTGKGGITETLRLSGVATKAESWDETSMTLLGDASDGSSILIKRKTSLESK